jgi:two-component system LytT family response regulator
MKLKAVIVDDDPSIFTVIKDLCKGSLLVEIVSTYTDPEDFLKVAPSIEFDLALLDIQMDKMLGTDVASKLNDKAVIYITGAFNYLKDAISTPYAGVVLKPIDKHLLDSTIEKVHAFLLSKREKFEKPEHKLFDIANGKNKVKLRLRDIFLVTTDINNPRHKHVTVREGLQYEIIDYNLDELLELSPDLLQANKSELVSVDAVNEVTETSIVLKGIIEKGKPKQISLSRSFKKDFLTRIGYR